MARLSFRFLLTLIAKICAPWVALSDDRACFISYCCVTMERCFESWDFVFSLLSVAVSLFTRFWDSREEVRERAMLLSVADPNPNPATLLVLIIIVWGVISIFSFVKPGIWRLVVFAFANVVLSWFRGGYLDPPLLRKLIGRAVAGIVIWGLK